MSETFKYHVAMSCSGCSGAVTRVLNKAKEAGEVTDFGVNLPGQYATVTAGADKKDAIFEKIAKTGKATHDYAAWAAEHPDEAAAAEKAAAEEAAKA